MSPIRPDPKPLKKGLSQAARKKLRPERFCSDAAHPRCYKPRVHFGMCKPHADEHMNTLLRRIVVPNAATACEAAAWHAAVFPCGGEIQVNHIFRRGRYLTRWLLANVIPGCAALNVWAHMNEDWFHKMFRDWRGDAAYKALEAIAFGKGKPDWEEAHRVLHAQLDESCEHLEAA